MLQVRRGRSAGIEESSSRDSSCSSTSQRLGSIARQQREKRALVLSRGRSAPTLGNVLAEAIKLAERRRQEAERRQGRATRRMAGETAKSSVIPMPPVVERVGSAGSGMQLSSNSGSPVSGAGDGPIGAMVQQQAAFQIFPLR